MKVFTASQIRACDSYTVHASKITSYDLMERASTNCVKWLEGKYSPDTVYVVLCGSGNNGGDGLAITRMLYKKGYSAKAFVLMLGDEMTADCKANYDRLQKINDGLVQVLSEDSFITDMPSNVVVVDAILGTGLNRPVEGWVAEFIEHINELPNEVVSVDIPSGMPADSIPKEGAAIINAQYTVSFQFYKKSFLHRETGQFAGAVHILDIGLSETFISSTQSNFHIVTDTLAKKLYKKRNPFTHKGDYGLAYIIAGSKGMMGAATLATKAALRSGAGKVKALVPECGFDIIQTSVPEAMCDASGETNISRIKNWEEADAVGIGCGIGTSDATSRTFSDYITACKKPTVIDADGLNLLAEQQELIHKIPADSILTPHPKEFERLFGKSKDSMYMLENARTQSMKYNLYIVLKGHHTAIITPEGECLYNMTGNAGMATGGSGDVLAGLITGLLAQGYTSFEAAVLGVYIHGLAGDLAAQKRSQEALIAGDIIDRFGKAFVFLSN